MNKKHRNESVVPSDKMRWTCHTPNLLKEIVKANPTASILRKPIMILGQILHEVAERCSQLNDPILNDLMCRLTFYSIANPEDKEHYDKDRVEEIRLKALDVEQDNTKTA